MSPGILDQKRTKLPQMAGGRVRVEFYEHDILDLDSLAAVQDGAFDVITCFSVFELLPDLYKALAHWCRYLAPGGIVALHATHQIAGLAFEWTASELGISLPYSLSWSRSEKKLCDAFKKTDLEVLSVKLGHQQDGIHKFSGVSDEIVDAFFEAHTRSPIAHTFQAKAESDADFLNRAKELFRVEWAAGASNDLPDEINGVWEGVARKPTFSTESKLPINQPKVVGGCRCSAVRYEAYRLPAKIIVCHCFTCGRLSGSGNLPFIDVPTTSLRYTESRGLKTLKFSDVAERTFCTECGSPITMTFDGTRYENERGKTNIILGSVDMESLDTELPGVWGHIYIGEKRT